MDTQKDNIKICSTTTGISLSIDAFAFKKNDILLVEKYSITKDSMFYTLVLEFLKRENDVVIIDSSGMLKQICTSATLIEYEKISTGLFEFFGSQGNRLIANKGPHFVIPIIASVLHKKINELCGYNIRFEVSLIECLVRFSYSLKGIYQYDKKSWLNELPSLDKEFSQILTKLIDLVTPHQEASIKKEAISWFKKYSLDIDILLNKNTLTTAIWLEKLIQIANVKNQCFSIPDEDGEFDVLTPYKHKSIINELCSNNDFKLIDTSKLTPFEQNLSYSYILELLLEKEISPYKNKVNKQTVIMVNGIDTFCLNKDGIFDFNQNNRILYNLNSDNTRFVYKIGTKCNDKKIDAIKNTINCYYKGDFSKINVINNTSDKTLPENIIVCKEDDFNVTSAYFMLNDYDYVGKKSLRRNSVQFSNILFLGNSVFRNSTFNNLAMELKERNHSVHIVTTDIQVQKKVISKTQERENLFKNAKMFTKISKSSYYVQLEQKEFELVNNIPTLHLGKQYPEVYCLIIISIIENMLLERSEKRLCRKKSFLFINYFTLEDFDMQEHKELYIKMLRLIELSMLKGINIVLAAKSNSSHWEQFSQYFDTKILFDDLFNNDIYLDKELFVEREDIDYLNNNEGAFIYVQNGEIKRGKRKWKNLCKNGDAIW